MRRSIPELYGRSCKNVKVEFNLSNYAMKRLLHKNYRIENKIPSVTGLVTTVALNAKAT